MEKDLSRKLPVVYVPRKTRIVEVLVSTEDVGGFTVIYYWFHFPFDWSPRFKPYDWESVAYAVRRGVAVKVFWRPHYRYGCGRPVRLNGRPVIHISRFGNAPRVTPIWDLISVFDSAFIRNRRASKIIAPAPSREWAPCMVALRNRVADAGHFGLFSLAAYMANRGYDVNSIVDVLRVRSDFDERIARYQVEHIAGLRGSRVKYKPPSCQSMKTHGLCIDNGRQCPHNIKNPLQYRPTGSAGPKQGSG